MQKFNADIDIRNVETFDALLDIEDEVYHSVCVLDTQLNRTYLENNYDHSAWLVISDMAWTIVIARLPLDLIDENKNLREHLHRHYLNAENWISNDDID